MQFKNLFIDDDAVSPVIGVILMVAITVILAAVIGAFVLGIGGSQETVPNANWQISYEAGPSNSEFESSATYDTDDKLTIKHRGGDEINVDELVVSVGGTRVSNLDDGTQAFVSSSDSFPSEVSAGNTVTIVEADDDTGAAPDSNDLQIQKDDKVQVIWQSSSSDKSQVLNDGTVP